ncbi:hypothetical protein [Terasakiella pusilla]|uniref:hypothetical protein n=1 Tax=Terasakiella pusilla TaxID=64973 RepID=UPI00048F77F2|nr:hypothetical protein [Terasakiella pusilla]
MYIHLMDVHSPRVSAVANGVNFHQIHIVGENLLIDGTLVDCVMEDQHVTWIRSLADGDTEYGRMTLWRKGLACLANGMVERNGQVHTFTASSGCTYRMETIDQNGKALQWYNIEIGFKEVKSATGDGNTHIIPFSQLLYPEGSDLFEDINMSAGELDDLSPGDEGYSDAPAFYTPILGLKEGELVNPEDESDPARYPQKLKCDVTFRTIFLDYISQTRKYGTAEIDFSLDYHDISGKASVYDPMLMPDDDHETHTIKGSLIDAADYKATVTLARTLVQAQNGRPQSIGSNIVALATQRLFSANKNTSPNLTLSNLFTLPAPNNDQVQERAFDKAQQLMFYAIDDHDLALFGRSRPRVGPYEVLKEDDIALLKDENINDFLKNDFCTGYLTESYSQSDIQEIKDEIQKISNLEDKMSYFWSGSGETSFSNSLGYNLTMTHMVDRTFIDLTPGLKDYLNDNPTKWAKDLYDYCTQKEILNGLALTNFMDGQTRITQLSNTLHALDPRALLQTEDGRTISFATALHEQVVNLNLNQFIINFMQDGEIELESFLTESYKALFEGLINNPTFMGEATEAARADLEKLMKEMGTRSVDKIVADMSGTIASITVILSERTPLSLEQRLAKMQKLVEGSTSKKLFTLFMGVIGYGGAIYSIVRTYMNWGDLDTYRRTGVILQTVTVTASIFSRTSLYAASKALTGIEAKATEMMKAGIKVNTELERQSAIKFCSKLSKEADINFELGVVEHGAAASSKDLQKLKSLNKSAERWQRTAKVSAKFAQGAIVLSLGAACVGMGFKIANDFKNGESGWVKTIDILQEVTLGFSFLAETVILFRGASVARCIPYASAVMAVAGLILCIVDLFIKRKKPKSEAEKFIENRSTPFVESLDMPKDDWQEPSRDLYDSQDDNKAALAV